MPLCFKSHRIWTIKKKIGPLVLRNSIWKPYDFQIPGVVLYTLVVICYLCHTSLDRVINEGRNQIWREDVKYAEKEQLRDIASPVKDSRKSKVVRDNI